MALSLVRCSSGGGGLPWKCITYFRRLFDFVDSGLFLLDSCFVFGLLLVFLVIWANDWVLVVAWFLSHVGLCLF